MKDIWLVARLDFAECLRARWFLVHVLVFGGIMAVLLLLGLGQSRVMGFTGLSRLLMVYIQICMALLPVFILLTTVRSVVGDRETGVFEYMLSLPVKVSSWYLGRILGRLVTILFPVFSAMAGAAAWAVISGYAIPWTLFGLCCALLMALAWCFLGIGMLISSLSRGTEAAQVYAFMLWLCLLLLLDFVLLGVLMREYVPLPVVVGIALANPLQTFRTVSMMIFDPQMMLLGPAAYVILDVLGGKAFLIFGIVYPSVLGLLSAWLGYAQFSRNDLSH